MYLPLNKGSSYLSEKFNWKFKINIRERVTKGICEFLKTGH